MVGTNDQRWQQVVTAVDHVFATEAGRMLDPGLAPHDRETRTLKVRLPASPGRHGDPGEYTYQLSEQQLLNDDPMTIAHEFYAGYSKATQQ